VRTVNIYKNIGLVIINSFFFIYFLITYKDNIAVSHKVIDVFISTSLITIFYLFFRTQILNAVFGFAILMVLITGEILRLSLDQINYTGWLIKDIFTDSNRNETNIIISVFLAFFLTISLWVGRKNYNYFKIVNINVNKNKKAIDWVAGITLTLGILFTIISSGKPLTEASYGSGGQPIEIGKESSSVGYILGLSFLISSIFLVFYNHNIKDKIAKLISLLAVFTVLNYNLFRGDRDGTLTFFIGLMGCYFIYSKEKIRIKVFKLLSFGVVLFFVLVLTGQIRNSIASTGFWEAIKSSQFFDNHSNSKSSLLDKLDLLPMMYWHTIDVNVLVKEGKLYNWKSYINLFSQSTPTPLANLLGLKRPRNIAWDLSEYFPHGGGFFIVAESYWNGGLLSCIFFSWFLSWFLSKLELWFFKQPKYLMGFYFGLIATFPTCVYYSIQGLARWIEVWFFLALFTKIWVSTVGDIIQRKEKQRQVNLV